MVMADQLVAMATGVYGHPLIKTPNIDRLAERGQTFEAAYSNCPICAPPRACMCRGRYISEINVFDNGTDFLSSIPTFMHHLGRAGSFQLKVEASVEGVGADSRIFDVRIREA